MLAAGGRRTYNLTGAGEWSHLPALPERLSCRDEILRTLWDPYWHGIARLAHAEARRGVL